MTDAVPDGPRNTLVVGPRGSVTDEVCVDLLSETGPEATHLLSVTFDREPDQLLGNYRTRHGELPAKAGIIEVGGQTRSSATAAPSGPGPTPVTLEAIDDPTDLTGLSMAISAYLDAWEDDDETPVVCVHSLSTWLTQANDLRVFKFLHQLTGRLKSIGARAHFHIDPEVHDEETINRFAGLMDAVITVDDAGDTAVRTRRQTA